MNCRHAQSLLSEYLNDALPAWDALRLRQHLNECNECARTYHELRRTVDLLAHARQYRVPETFDAALEKRLAGLRPRTGVRAMAVQYFAAICHPKRWSLGIAAGALCLVLVWKLGLPFGMEARIHPEAAAEASLVRDALRQNVAISASDPFADIAATNLTAHASSSEAGAAPSIE